MKDIGTIVWFGIAFILFSLLNSFILLFEVTQGIPVAMGGVGFIGIAWFFGISGAFLMFLGVILQSLVIYGYLL